MAPPDLQERRDLPPGDKEAVDQETQARLEALLEAAGISRLSGENKQLADPEILRRLTSSVRYHDNTEDLSVLDYSGLVLS